jgi:hypothetical protein
VLEVPRLLDFQVKLEYPSYLGKSSEIKKGTGNVTVPEGTNIVWDLQTRSTDEVVFLTSDSLQQFSREGDNFSFSSAFFRNTNYQVKTSNENLRDYESLDYSVSVIKDQYPEIAVQHQRDTTGIEEIYFFGKVSDDHGVSRLNLVYYKNREGEETAFKKVYRLAGRFTMNSSIAFLAK